MEEKFNDNFLEDEIFSKNEYNHANWNDILNKDINICHNELEHFRYCYIRNNGIENCKQLEYILTKCFAKYGLIIK